MGLSIEEMQFAICKRLEVLGKEGQENIIEGLCLTYSMSSPGLLRT
jgi:hypothetical protein